MVRLTTSDSEKSQANVSVPREKRALMWLRGTVQPSVGPVITASHSTRTIKKFFVTIFIRRRRTQVTDDDGIQTRARRICLCRVGDAATVGNGFFRRVDQDSCVLMTRSFVACLLRPT
jgi:hypothetical protein